ncbi:MAG: hypothetical protein NXI30_04380 [bacterium]|nr:hypothetical protein [bacterium]
MPDYKDLFPKSFKARDFRNAPKVLTIASVEPRQMENREGKVSTKLCIKFEETANFWLAGKKEACASIAEAVGSEDVDVWIGCSIELFEDETDFGDDRVDCVRARQPEGGQRRKPDSAEPRSPHEDTPLFPRITGTTPDGLVLIQLREGGTVFEIPPDDLEGVVSGEITLDEEYDRFGSESPDVDDEQANELAALHKRLAELKAAS